MGKFYIKAFSILLLGLSSISLYSQQDAQYTQYMYNTVSINPAYAGNRDVLSVVGLHRNQWVGIEGAPRTSTLSLSTPLGESRRVGLGTSIIQDEIGPSKETYLSIDFSYTIPTSEKGRLSFGLKASAQLIDVDFSKLNINEISDPTYATNIDNRFNPNVGVGLFYHSEKFYMGLSVPNLLETEHFDRQNFVGNQSSGVTAQEDTNFYFITGKVFTLSDSVLLKPVLLSKLVFGAPLQVDLSANFLIHEKFTLGAAYRWDAAFSGLAGFQVSDSIFIGLAYDRETTDLQRFNDGSFELLLRFDLFKKYSQVITPRFF